MIPNKFISQSSRIQSVHFLRLSSFVGYANSTSMLHTKYMLHFCNWCSHALHAYTPQIFQVVFHCHCISSWTMSTYVRIILVEFPKKPPQNLAHEYTKTHANKHTIHLKYIVVSYSAYHLPSNKAPFIYTSVLHFPSLCSHDSFFAYFPLLMCHI